MDNNELQEVVDGISTAFNVDNVDITEDRRENRLRQALENTTVFTTPQSNRFGGANWYFAIKDCNVAIIGAGGIGSHAAIALSKMCHNILLFDDDTLKLHNMGGQFYTDMMIGWNKTTALSEMLNLLKDKRCKVVAFTQRFDPNYWYRLSSYGTNVLICAVDNMESRKQVFETWKKEEKAPFIFMDARLNAEEFQLFTIIKGDEYSTKRYEEEYLFSSEEAEPTICSYKQTFYCAGILGNIIANNLINIISTEELKFPRDYAFRLYYNGYTMTLNKFND